MTSFRSSAGSSFSPHFASGFEAAPHAPGAHPVTHENPECRISNVESCGREDAIELDCGRDYGFGPPQTALLCDFRHSKFDILRALNLERAIFEAVPHAPRGAPKRMKMGAEGGSRPPHGTEMMPSTRNGLMVEGLDYRMIPIAVWQPAPTVRHATCLVLRRSLGLFSEEDAGIGRAA